MTQSAPDLHAPSIADSRSSTSTTKSGALPSHRSGDDRFSDGSSLTTSTRDSRATAMRSSISSATRTRQPRSQRRRSITRASSRSSRLRTASRLDSAPAATAARRAGGGVLRRPDGSGSAGITLLSVHRGFVLRALVSGTRVFSGARPAQNSGASIGGSEPHIHILLDSYSFHLALPKSAH